MEDCIGQGSRWGCSDPRTPRVLLVGGGVSGRLLLQAFNKIEPKPYFIIGIIDDAEVEPVRARRGYADHVPQLTIDAVDQTEVALHAVGEHLAAFKHTPAVAVFSAELIALFHRIYKLPEPPLSGH